MLAFSKASSAISIWNRIDVVARSILNSARHASLKSAKKDQLIGSSPFLADR
jgi:hypothetical protein